jgi:hypothetical protein
MHIELSLPAYTHRSKDWPIDPSKLVSEICHPGTTDLPQLLPCPERFARFYADRAFDDIHSLGNLGQMHTLIAPEAREERFAGRDLAQSYGESVVDRYSFYRKTNLVLPMPYSDFAGMSLKFVTRLTKDFLNDVEQAVVASGITRGELSALDAFAADITTSQACGGGELRPAVRAHFMKCAKPVHDGLHRMGYSHREIVGNF